MSARAIEPEELLQLAGLEAGRGRPRTIDLRRSVSSSYYAVFHRLTTDCTVEVFGPDPSREGQRRDATRWLHHGDVRGLTECVLGKRNPELSRVLGQVSAGVRQVSQTFGDLQDARHAADYDHDYEVDKRAALIHLILAQRAVAIARRMTDSGDPSYVLFLRLMIGAVRVARKR